MTPKLLMAAATLTALAGAPALAQNIDVGGELYQQYCSTCHGADGKGAGQLTEILTTKVPDLVGLSSRNGGIFPMLEVIHIIDGRTGVRAHGGPMPVYGEIFTRSSPAKGTYDQVLEARGMVLSLAYYLETIQGQ